MEEKQQPKYRVIARAKISSNRDIVISECVKGGFTIAQQVETIDDVKGKSTIYLRGALHVDALENLYNMRDALNYVIEKAEKDNLDFSQIWDT